MATSLGSGLTHRVALLAVPDGDVSALSSLVQVSPTSWEFTPSASVYGTYRVELIVDENLPTEARTVHTFAIRTPAAGLRIPAYNERSDPNASAIDYGGARVAASETNEPSPAYPLGEPFGWWRSLVETMRRVEALTAGGGGGSGKQSNRIIVGNAPAGDTLAICDFLDPGDGSGITAALAASAIGINDVWLRPGYYGNPGAVWNVPPGVTLQGVDPAVVILASGSASRQAFAVNTGSRIAGFSISIPPPDPGAVDTALIGIAGGAMERINVVGTALSPGDPNESLSRMVSVISTTGQPLPSIKNCYFIGALGAPTLTSLLRAIEVSAGCSNVSIQRCHIVDFDDGIWLYGSDHTVIGCTITGASRLGITLVDAMRCRVLGNRVETVATAWPGTPVSVQASGSSGQNMIVSNNVDAPSTGIGIKLDCATGHAYGTNNVSSNVIENDSGSAIELTATEAGSIVIANSTRGGTITDAGINNVVAHNNTYVTP